MMRRLVQISIFSCAAFSCHAIELDLAGEWTLSGSNEVGAAISCPIAVPGDVHSALFAARLIPDPFWGCNETNVQWVARADWTLSRDFTVDPDFVGRRRIVLEAEDVDTFAEIYLNGEKVGATSDRFSRWTLDVKGKLRPGRNEIRAVFRSAWLEGDRRRAEAGRPYPMGNSRWAKNHALIRKPACHAGWDWGLAQMTVGFCGSVKLIAHDGPKIDYVHSQQAFNGDLTHCDLTVFADVTEADGRTHTVTNVVPIDNPPLWWPAGAGEQKFYEYEIDVCGQKLKRKVGLRKLEVVTTPDTDETGKPGSRMAIRVNGREIFMKGANWIPCDAFESRQTPERYRDLLESAKAANMNMIRLWGGGQFEKDAFYDVCDELGILVWHDHMFACATYPGDERFLAEVRNELAHQIRRLCDHPSIALWCGDNECIGALNWYPETRKEKDFYKSALIRRHAVQAEAVGRYDPARMFWPSSPCAGPGDFADNWKDDSKGDMHNWQVWHSNKPFDAYYAYRPRFCSEFGYQSFPSMEVAETFATREQILSHAPEFEWHQKNDGGNRRIRETMLRYFNPPKDAESELLLSQFQQGMAIKMAADGWRAQRPRCMGTLFWQLNDNWPVASWSSIEYGGKWKPLQYMAKRFYAPVAVVAQPEITNGKADVKKGSVFALNDTAKTVKGELLVEYWTYEGKVVSAETKAVALPPDSSTEVASFAHRPETFLVLALKTEFGTYQNDWHFGFYKDMPLAEAKVEAKMGRKGDGQATVVLSTDRPAFFVWANVRGVRGEFDDNCLTLLPGRPRTIVFTAKDPGCAPAALSGNLSVRDLSSVVGKGAAALPMPTGKATVETGLGSGDVVTNCIPVREGNVVTALNKRLVISPRSGSLSLVVNDETVFTCGENYCFADGNGKSSWNVFQTGYGRRKWHSRIEAREENGAYVTEAYLKTSSGEEHLQNRTSLTILPDGLVKATFEGFPSRDETCVKVQNPNALFFGGGAKTLPGCSADFNGKVVAFDEKPTFEARCKGAADYPITYYLGDPVREFKVTVPGGLSGSVGWGVWLKGRLHGHFDVPGVKTVYIDLRRGVWQPAKPNVRGGVDWRVTENLEMPERRRNLFENGSFERGWRCWDSFKQAFGGATPARWDTEYFAIDETVAHTGRRSLRCLAPEMRNCPSPYGQETMSTTLCPVPEPGRYTVSFWAKATSSDVFVSAWCPAFSYALDSGLVSKWMPKSKAMNRHFRVSTEWTRYSFSFDIPKADPFKLVFSVATPKGKGRGQAWIDDVQFEQGDAPTAYEKPVAEAELVMSDPDQFCELGKPLEARLRVFADEPGAMRVEVKSFLDEPIWKKTVRFTPKDGIAEIALDGLDEALPGAGVYKMKRRFVMASGKRAFEHDRFTVAKYLDNVPRKWRFLQLDYGDPMENAGVRRELARWRRIGIDRLYGPPSGLNPTVRALVESYGLDCGAYRIARGGISERYAPDPAKPNVTRNRLLKGASVIGVDYDSRHPGDYSVTNTPGVTAYLLGHRLLGVPLDAAYLKRVEDAAAAKVAHHPDVRCWECSSEINCALSYDYWSDDSNWEQQMRGFSKWLAAIYRGAKRANPKAIVSNDSAMNMSASCLEEIKATMRYCAEEGVRFDAIGAHTYRYSPESPDLDEGFQSLTEEAVRLGYPADVPFVCGEGMHWGPYEVPAWGLQSANWMGNPSSWWGMPAALSYDIGRTEIRSAAWRARSWLVAYKYARRMLEMNSGNVNNFELDANGTPFLSQIISSVLVDLLGSADFVEDVRFAPYCRAYVFTDEKGRGIAALWNHRPAVDEGREDAPMAEADFGDALEDVRDMVGSHRSFAGRGSFAVTPQPLYFISKPGRTADLVAAVKNLRVAAAAKKESVGTSFNPSAPDATAITIRDYTGAVSNVVERIDPPLTADAVRTVKSPFLKKSYPAFLVPHVDEKATAGTIDWSKVPAMELTSRSGKPGPGFSAKQQLVWNRAALYLRVTVTDPAFVHRDSMPVESRYDNDCLQVFLDGCANARFNSRKGFDDDDYEYDVFPSSDGRSSCVFRRRSPDIQLTLGIYAPKNGVIAEELPSAFGRTPTGYVYTLTMPAKYVLPLRLEKGRVIGVGISVSDANDEKRPLGKRVAGMLTNLAESGKGPYERPQLWPSALLWADE